MITTNTQETTTYTPIETIAQVLIEGGMSSVYTVDFTKENGDQRRITGVLVKPIDGPLGTNVALKTTEGFKSFNTGRVQYIKQENN